MDEGSGSDGLVEKPPMVSPSFDEVGGVFLRSDRGLDVVVAGDASSGAPPSSGTEMGQVVFVATAVD